MLHWSYQNQLLEKFYIFVNISGDLFDLGGVTKISSSFFLVILRFKIKKTASGNLHFTKVNFCLYLVASVD